MTLRVAPAGIVRAAYCVETSDAAYDQAVRFRRFGLPLLAAAAAASLAGCSSSGATLPALGGQRHTDGVFVRLMTAHERGAVAVTRLAQHGAHRRELRRIARAMTTEQNQDVRALGQLGRAAAGRPPPPPSSAGLNAARVGNATSFDYEFMQTMIEQNQAAIAIARRELSTGSDPLLKQLAGVIAASRQKELDRLRAWLHDWYGNVQPAPGPAPAPPPNGSPPI